MCESSNSLVRDAFNALASELDEGGASGKEFSGRRRSQAVSKAAKQTLVIKFQSQMTDLMHGGGQQGHPGIYRKTYIYIYEYIYIYIYIYIYAINIYI